MGAAKIDHLLLQILDKYLLPCPSAQDDLLEGDSPLATFSSRIRACHRLGLIDDQFAKLLNTFRKLRNGFAHEVESGSLKAGSARDRTIAMAEPFAKTEFFRALVGWIAAETKRDPSDAGVVFRASLAMFHLQLVRLHEELAPVERSKSLDVVTRCARAEAPEKYAPKAG